MSAGHEFRAKSCPAAVIEFEYGEELGRIVSDLRGLGHDIEHIHVHIDPDMNVDLRGNCPKCGCYFELYAPDFVINVYRGGGQCRLLQEEAASYAVMTCNDVTVKEVIE